MTPFRETLDWYYRIRDSLIVVSSLLPRYEREMPEYNVYLGMTTDEIQTAISKDTLELEDITISSLFFRFEAEIYTNFPNSTETIEEVINSNSSFLGNELLEDTHHLREYRNWVTHGKRWNKPITVEVLQAYETLTTFLTVTNLI